MSLNQQTISDFFFALNGIDNFTSSSGEQSGNWYAIQCIGDTVFTTLTEEGSGTLAGVTVSDGTIITGIFTVIHVASGRIRAAITPE